MFYTEYLRTQHLLITTICVGEYFLFKTTRQKYNRQTSIDNIERQLNSAIVKTDILLLIYKQFKLAFLKRSRIEKILFFEKSSILLLERDSNWRVSFINDLIALYRRRERCSSSKYRKSRNIKNKSNKSKEKKSAIFELYFLQYRLYQYLFCLDSIDLTNDNCCYNFITRYLLRRYLQCCYIKRLHKSDSIYCLYFYANCIELILKDSKHFKNYVVRIYFVKI